MSIQIFNSLTRQKEAFVPLEEGKVKMYVCGPTVYNYIHIGNARPVIVYDTVRRYLEYRGYDVKYVSNFTDVDDKLIKAANELGEEVPEIAERFINAYFDNTKALGCAEADVHPRVTGHMPISSPILDPFLRKSSSVSKRSSKKAMLTNRKAMFITIRVNSMGMENYPTNQWMN